MLLFGVFMNEISVALNIILHITYCVIFDCRCFCEWDTANIAELHYDRLLLVVDVQISDELSSVVVAQLLFLQSESNKKPIHMYINSPGLGNITE